MHLLPALVVGLTAGFLAVQDLKDEKSPVRKDEVEKKDPLMTAYNDLVDEYLQSDMEEDISEEIGEAPEDEDDEETAEGETIRAISEQEYDEGAFGFEHVNLLYYVDDEVLCDSDLITIDNKDEWLGDVDLILGSDHITVMWIRNFDLSYDIRLEIIEESYSGSR